MTSAATSTTLFREGQDLDEILDDLDAEFPGRVRVVDVSYDRVGGVMGFFAHRNVCVRYTLDDLEGSGSFDDFADQLRTSGLDSFTAGAAPAVRADTAGSPLEALLSAAEAEDMITTGRSSASALRVDAEGTGADDTTMAEPANIEFARMLLDMATAKAAERRAAEGIVDETGQAATVEAPATNSLPAPTAAPIIDTVVPTAPAAVESAPAAFPTLSELLAANPVDAAPPSTPSLPAAPPPAAVPAPLTPLTPATPEPSSARQPSSAVVDRDPAPAPTRVPGRRAPGAHRAPEHATPERSEYPLRRQLVEIGVPVSWIPEGTSDAYWVIEQLAARVPTVESTYVRPGDVLAVVGPAREALRAARQLCQRLRLDPESVLAVGCDDGAVAADKSLGQPWAVASAVAQSRSTARSPLVVAVATDESGADLIAADDAWLRETVRALSADQLFLVTDATRKPADTRGLIRTLGRVDALIVTGASRTTSPASVWELEIPIALLDGRASTRGAWVALLVDKLTTMEA